MYTIDNMSIKNYIKDRVYLYFKPLLCCINLSWFKSKGSCHSCVFTDNIVDTLKTHTFDVNSTQVYNYDRSPKVEVVSVFSPVNIDIIRKRYA